MGREVFSPSFRSIPAWEGVITVGAVSLVNNTTPVTVLERVQDVQQMQLGSHALRDQSLRQSTVTAPPDEEKLRMRDDAEERRGGNRRDEKTGATEPQEEAKEGAAEPRGLDLKV
jgi:hypothetical protein